MLVAEQLRAEVFKAEESTSVPACNVHVTHMTTLRWNAISVELVASYDGWRAFVDNLSTRGLNVETRRWHKFNEDVFVYDIYVEGASRG